MMKRPTIKPWQKLGISRKEYLAAKPWKEHGMSREKFESMILSMTQKVVADTRLKQEADKLGEAIFSSRVSKNDQK